MIGDPERVRTIFQQQDVFHEGNHSYTGSTVDIASAILASGETWRATLHTLVLNSNGRLIAPVLVSAIAVHCQVRCRNRPHRFLLNASSIILIMQRLRELHLIGVERSMGERCVYEALAHLPKLEALYAGADDPGDGWNIEPEEEGVLLGSKSLDELARLQEELVRQRGGPRVSLWLLKCAHLVERLVQAGRPLPAVREVHINVYPRDTTEHLVALRALCPAAVTRCYYRDGVVEEAEEGEEEETEAGAGAEAGVEKSIDT